jgi:hypothetical protein
MLDLDLLVHPADVVDARKVIESEGLRPSHTTTPSLAPGIEYARGHLHLDLHRSLAPRGSVLRGSAATGWFLEQTEAVSLCKTRVRCMEPVRAFAAAAALLAKDVYDPQLIRPVRIVELGLRADAVSEAGEEQACSWLESCSAGRVAQRTRDLLLWLREGRRPEWIDAGFSNPESIRQGPTSAWRRLMRGAALQSGGKQTVRYAVVRLFFELLYRGSRGRLAHW